MTFREMLQAAVDFWRPNRHALKSFLVKDGKKHPFAVICPGGGYDMVCSFVEGLPYAKALNEKGYHAFVVYYRLKNQARYPAPHDDLEQTIQEILAHAAEWKLDTRCWSLWGSSAGGHLAASFCTEDRGCPKPGALILSYPVITMGELTHEGSRDNLLGKPADPSMIDRLSVERHITADYAPTYVWCGTADQLVSPENSRMLANALEDNGVPYVFEQLENIGHGVGLGNGLAWFDHAVQFWERMRQKQ